MSVFANSKDIPTFSKVINKHNSVAGFPLVGQLKQVYLLSKQIRYKIIKKNILHWRQGMTKMYERVYSVYNICLQLSSVLEMPKM